MFANASLAIAMALTVLSRDSMVWRWKVAPRRWRRVLKAHKWFNHSDIDNGRKVATIEIQCSGTQMTCGAGVPVNSHDEGGKKNYSFLLR